MSDLQLAILLRQIHQRLITEIEEVERQLPESMREVYQNKLIPAFSPTVSYPVMDDLRAMAQDLSESVRNLERATA